MKRFLLWGGERGEDEGFFGGVVHKLNIMVFFPSIGSLFNFVVIIQNEAVPHVQLLE